VAQWLTPKLPYLLPLLLVSKTIIISYKRGGGGVVMFNRKYFLLEGYKIWRRVTSHKIAIFLLVV
jgi:hypothetical protein